MYVIYYTAVAATMLRNYFFFTFLFFFIHIYIHFFYVIKHVDFVGWMNNENGGRVVAVKRFVALAALSPRYSPHTAAAAAAVCFSCYHYILYYYYTRHTVLIIDL